MENTQQLVDAVITWVDGSDPNHAAHLNKFLEERGIVRPSTVSKTRLNDSGELAYCLSSIFRYAPWIRNIHIITDNQTPSFLFKLKGTEFEDRIHIVDHKEVFSGYEDCLPSYNIRSLSMVLWRVPNLADEFVFLNDDFAFIRDVSREDFFSNNGIVIRGGWAKQKNHSFIKKVKRKILSFIKGEQNVRAGHMVAQELSAIVVGFSGRFFKIEHNPHPMRIVTFRKFCEENKTLFEENIKYPFRSVRQYIGEALSVSLELSAGTATINNQYQTLQLKPADQSLHKIKERITLADKDNSFAFVCVQGLDSASEESQKTIISWLNKRIPLIDGFTEE